MTTQPKSLQNLSPEQRARQSAGNTTAKGMKGRAASPWNKSPNCATKRAKASFETYLKRGTPADTLATETK